jgi:hypothetical protein
VYKNAKERNVINQNRREGYQSIFVVVERECEGFAGADEGGQELGGAFASKCPQ